MPPIYVYEEINEDDSGGDQFEIMQKMSDKPLKKHPETKKPVRRIIQAPNIAGNWSDMKGKSRMSNKNLDRLGFTKYERAGDGKYEKKAGKGPNVISADD